MSVLQQQIVTNFLQIVNNLFMFNKFISAILACSLTFRITTIAARTNRC